VTEREEILLKIDELKGRLNVLSYSDISQIEKLYITVFRVKIKQCNCGKTDKYRDALSEIYYYLQKNKNFMEKKSNYMLKAGVILQMPSDINVYTNANLTDDVAERYLKDNIKRENLFQVKPEDWMDRINGKEKTTTKNKNDNGNKKNSSKESEAQTVLTPEEKNTEAKHPDILD